MNPITAFIFLARDIVLKRLNFLGSLILYLKKFVVLSTLFIGLRLFSLNHFLAFFVVKFFLLNNTACISDIMCYILIIYKLWRFITYYFNIRLDILEDLFIFILISIEIAYVSYYYISFRDLLLYYI